MMRATAAKELKSKSEQAREFWKEKLRNLRIVKSEKEAALPEWDFEKDPELEYARVEERYNCLASNWEWFARTEGIDYPKAREEAAKAARTDQN